MDLYLKLELASDYLVFLHDKRSPQSLDGVGWTEKLFRIIAPAVVPGILDLLGEKKAGMVGAKEHIITSASGDEMLYANNRVLLEELGRKFSMKLKNLSYVGGTMFWVKAKIFHDFFSKNPPLEIRRTLEHGNVIDNISPVCVRYP